MATGTHILDVHIEPSHAAAALRADVQAGLSASPKSLPPKWFYDQVGSELFEAITELPEYYPTRTERALLTAHAEEIAAAVSAQTLVELGSGSSLKTRLLLDALRGHGTLGTYVAQDVSESALLVAAEQIATDYPQVGVHAVVSDFTAGFATLPRYPDRLVIFLGGTIGNLVPAERAAFFTDLHAHLLPGEHLLLGAGLVTDEATMVAAYDDAAGVTAQFNRNVLRVINRELAADFPVEDFRHVALWDAGNSWIEMRLRALRAMRVSIPGADTTVDFAAGEEVRTEISAKFELGSLHGELADAGLAPVRDWVDPQRRFALTLARRGD